MNRYRITDQNGNLVGEFVGEVANDITKVAPPSDTVHIAPGTFDQFRVRAKATEVRVLADTYSDSVDVQVLEQILGHKNDPMGYQAEMLRQEREAREMRRTTEEITNVKVDHAMGLVIVEDGYEVPGSVLKRIEELGYEVISKTALWRLECSAHLQGMRENMTRKGMLPGLATRGQQAKELVELLTRQEEHQLPAIYRQPPIAGYSDGSGNRADRRASAAKARRANKKRK